MAEDAPEPTLRVLAEQMEVLRVENRDLRRRLDAVESRSTPPPPAPPPVPRPTDGAEVDGDGRIDRRRLLRTGLAAGAASAAGLAVVAATSAPAAAADGQALLLGQTSSATSPTALRGPEVGHALEVHDGSPHPPERPYGDDPLRSRINAHATTSSGVAMLAANEGGVGIHAYGRTSGIRTSGADHGLRAEGDTGVLAEGSIGIEAIGSVGVLGRGASRAASFVSTNGDGVVIQAGSNHLRLRTTKAISAPPTTAIAHERGDIVLDSTDALWVCINGGTPGTWRKLSGTGTAGALHVLPAPVRIYDSRAGTFPPGSDKTPFAAGETRTLDLRANTSGVPAGATAALVTLLLVDAATTPGNLTVWAAGQARPQSNTVVWGGDARRFTASTVTALDDQARVHVHASQRTNLVIDVVGYYR